jgi:hypothetical protein
MKTMALTARCGFLVALILALSPSPAWSSAAQNSDQPTTSPEQAGSRLQIPPGTVISAVLTKGIEVKKAKTGDEVVAKVQNDIKNKAGEVLVPKDTRLMGKVTEAQPRSKEQKESRLGLVFDHAVLKDGTQCPVSMSIQAIADLQEAGAQGGNDSSYQQPGGYSGGGTGGGGGMAGGGMHGAYGGSTGSTGSMNRQPASTPAADSGDTGGPPRDGSQRTITPQTQGVIGIPDTQLSQASGSNGSLVTSDKSNVRLGAGTVLLLRVNQ